MSARSVASIGLSLLLATALWSQTLNQAAESFRAGRVQEAETTLRSLLAQHPDDMPSLMLLGVVLDSSRRYDEAEPLYRRALALAPQSPTLLSNLGNHYLAAGKPEAAASFYRKVIALDPRHVNANLHLAELSVAAKHGPDALAALNRLPPPEQAEPIAQLLRAQALALSDRCRESEGLLKPLEQRTTGDTSFSFSIGLAYAACRRYEDAENAFSTALKTDPANFDVLYNLGLVAHRAGHLDRARQVFEIALKQKLDDPDALYGLAETLAQSGEKMPAAVLLYRLQQTAPARPDALLLLARTTDELGYFEETAATYERYLRLRPKDDTARRERGFALARAGGVKDALLVLRAFVLAHPDDPRGQYELAVAEAMTDRQAGLRRLDRALVLAPDLFEARYARAVIRFQEEQPAPALEDFQLLLKREPENPKLLDWIGQIYLGMDRTAEAADVLKRALDRAPLDRAVLMHYSRALRDLNRREELAAVLATFQRAAASADSRRVRKGLFAFLDLPPEQQQSRYLEFLRGAAAADPADVIVRTRWADALLEQGRTAEAGEVFRQILAQSPAADARSECAAALLRHEQYALAAEFLKSLPDRRLDLALALYHSQSPQAGLSTLDQTPAAERKGDYYLLRAQILDALGKPEDAANDLNHGIRAAPTRADMYFQAAVFLIKHGRRDEAAQLLSDACRLLPDAAELALARAITLALARRTDEALKALTDLETRRPEWDRPYLIHGILLESTLKPAEAKQMLDTAIALGARDADAYYYQALTITQETPEKLDEAEQAVRQALALNPDDAAIQWLAGKILMDAKKPAPALEHLTAAARLDPGSVKVHYLLLKAYREAGDEPHSTEQQQILERISRSSPEPERASPMERLLFTIHRSEPRP